MCRRKPQTGSLFVLCSRVFSILLISYPSTGIAAQEPSNPATTEDAAPGRVAGWSTLNVMGRWPIDVAWTPDLRCPNGSFNTFAIVGTYRSFPQSVI